MELGASHLTRMVWASIWRDSYDADSFVQTNNDNVETYRTASASLSSGMKNTTARRRVTDPSVSCTLFRPGTMQKESLRNLELQGTEIQLKLLRSESENLSFNERIIDGQ